MGSVSRRIMTLWVFLTVLGLLAGGAASPSAAAGELVGTACVVDGDSIVIGGKRQRGRCVDGDRVRLFGIEAPDLVQLCDYPDGRQFLCGRYAASFLLEHVKGRTVTCTWDSQDGEGRYLGTCSVDGRELNRLMIEEGWAVVYRRHSERYVEVEAIARKAKRGLWSMKFAPSWERRKMK
ncbi:MAG: thermonuclease family protein [Rhodospirillales bacterium]|nr:thermonuclease family protein [Rhodospirillales bacterium]MCW8951131.1 thermonuclease family protein [Rhodospirillales bacterium]MCW8970810.1 thermonuclease family protein [Rhodospirillales bacterium]MCW9040145.1 thermonuclease family protein [Rhodospirillales bacterium]